MRYKQTDMNNVAQKDRKKLYYNNFVTSNFFGKSQPKRSQQVPG